MTDINFEGERAQAWVTQVAEVCIEPCYVSEIARKMLDSGLWQTSLHTAIRRAALAIEEYVEQHDGDDYKYSRYGNGHMTGSPHHSLGQPPDSYIGQSVSSDWKEYKILWNRATDTDEVVNTELLNYIDTDIGWEDKKKRIEVLANGGEQIAKNAELILQDQIPPAMFNHTPRTHVEEEIQTRFNDSGVDELVVARNPEMGTKAYAFEVSVRWVNPIGKPYIKSKRDEALDMESEVGMEVTTVLMAPKYATEYQTDIVKRYQVPTPRFGGTNTILGNPMIVRDSEERIEQIQNTGIFGDEYPIVQRDYNDFYQYASDAQRSIAKVTESEYRLAITDAITDLLPHRTEA